MSFELTGRRPAVLAGVRTAGFTVAMLAGLALSACTTTEGTNAFSDAATFEREVMTSTAQGLGLVPRDVKPDPANPRGPLVLPKDTASLPAPHSDTQAAMLPADSTAAKFDTTGLTADDLARLRRARVVDTNTPDGRPLTPEELQKLTAHMKQVTLSNKRSIFTPPAEYYSVDAKHNDLVCLAKNGDLVSVNDAACPPEIRKALLKKG